MPQRRGLISPQNTFLDTIATRFDGTHSNFVLGNAQSKDYPIVYCSDGFVELTGFSRVQIMSKSCSCSFLWGNDISDIEKSEINNALTTKSELKMEVIFCKKDGTTFLCLLDIVPIKNEKDQVVLFLVSHKNLSECQNIIDQEELDCDEGSNVEESKNLEISTSHKYQRRRSRAVLYQLSGQYSGKQKSKFHLENFRHKRTVPEYKVQETRSDRLIVLHYSLFKIIWDWLILLCTFYIAIYVPYNVVFLGDRHFLVFDIIVEVLFSIDIVLNFRTTYVNKAGQVVYKPRDIAKNYLKGWFVLDLFAALPFDAMSNIEMKFAVLTSQVQIMKLARLLRLIRLIQKIDRYTQYSFVLLALLMCSFALCAHWMACIWYLIGQREMNNNKTREINWLYELSVKINRSYFMNETVGGLTIRSIYISSLYFTCTSITSVGFGNVAPNTDAEKIFSICSMLVGALMHAAIFGNVTAIIQRMHARKTTYQTKNQDLKDFTKVHHIPKSLKQRMLEFFQTNWVINRGIEPSEILKDFPEEMRGDISLHLNKEMMSLPLFDKASNACKKSLAQQIKTIFATPGEYLLRRGDAIKYIFFVCSGSMEILDQYESVVALLGKFDLFGPDVSHYPSRSGYEVRALTYCELQCLILDCMDPLYEQYPEFKANFTTSILDELSFNVCDQFHEVNSSKESLLYLGNSSESINTLPLPAISEKEEYQSSDQICNHNETVIRSPRQIRTILSTRRYSQPDNLDNSNNYFKNNYDRRHSLPTESQIHLQKQLDQITMTNNSLIFQITSILKSVNKLSEDIKYMNDLFHNKFMLNKDSNSPELIKDDVNLSYANKHFQELQVHSSPENRVTFDLHPQEISRSDESPDSKISFKNFRSRTPKAINSIFNKKMVP